MLTKDLENRLNISNAPKEGYNIIDNLPQNNNYTQPTQCRL